MNHTRKEQIDKNYLDYLDNLNPELIEEQLNRQESDLEEHIEQYNKKQNGMNFINTEAANIVLSSILGKYVDDLKNIKNIKRLKYINAVFNHKIKNKSGKETNALKVEEIAFIVARNVLMFADDETTTLVKVAKNISKELVIQIRDNTIKSEHSRFYKKIQNNLTTLENGRQIRNNIRIGEKLIAEKKEEFGGITPYPTFTEVENINIGVKLIDLFSSCTGIIEKKNKVEKNKTTSYIYLKEETREQIEKIRNRLSIVKPRKMAMLIKPKPWTSLIGGGLLKKTDLKELFDIIDEREDGRDLDMSVLDDIFVRTFDKKALKKIHNEAQLDEVYDSVNMIQDVSWEINKDVFNLVDYLLDNGIPFINSKGDEVMISKYPKEVPARLPESITCEESIKKNKTEMFKVHTANNQSKGDRIVLGLKHKILKEYNNLENFWFTWNVDYRGRIYPIQTLVNPQGDDLIKSCLKFKEGKELGKNGLYWLKVHCANVAGEDKLSFDGRVKWVNENIEIVKAVGNNPLDTMEFYRNFDYPFQFVAVACEINRALQLEDPSKFVSHLAIALDGSNSGLQHWSAILLDEMTAKSVNVLQTEKPSDVYQDVADIVIRILKENVTNGNNKELSELWLNSNEVNRKLCKRPTMTTPYSVTSQGIRDQIRDHLKKSRSDKELIETQGSITYISNVVEEALNESIKSAREGMDWLKEVTNIVVKNNNTNVSWVTPLGFIVCQSYYKKTNKQIDTFFGGTRFQPNLKKTTKNVNINGSKNGIAPNYIHSLDATHLMMVVNRMKKEYGITNMYLIHDSFGTHAGDTELLHRVIREEFVKLYSGNILEDFKEEIIKNFPELRNELPELPRRYSMDIKDVLKSDYIFS